MVYYDIATRAQAITLKALNFSNEEIEQVCGVNRRTVSKWLDKAISRGFDPTLRPLRILDKYVEDAPKPGRPTLQTSENKEAVLAEVRTD